MKDSGPSEHVFDPIVWNDDCNLNEEKVALLAVRFTKFHRKKKPFLGILKKGFFFLKNLVNLSASRASFSSVGLESSFLTIGSKPCSLGPLSLMS